MAQTVQHMMRGRCEKWTEGGWREVEGGTLVGPYHPPLYHHFHTVTPSYHRSHTITP